MNEQLMLEKLKANIDVKEKQIVSDEMVFENDNILLVRDSIWKLGDILVEDIDNKLYVAHIKEGIATRNSAVIVIRKDDNKLYFMGYAREGLITQHTARKAIDKLKEILSNV